MPVTKVQRQKSFEAFLALAKEAVPRDAQKDGEGGWSQEYEIHGLIVYTKWWKNGGGVIIYPYPELRDWLFPEIFDHIHMGEGAVTFPDDIPFSQESVLLLSESEFSMASQEGWGTEDVMARLGLTDLARLRYYRAAIEAGVEEPRIWRSGFEESLPLEYLGAMQ